VAEDADAARGRTGKGRQDAERTRRTAGTPSRASSVGDVRYQSVSHPVPASAASTSARAPTSSAA
jgi:hypothetical protein